MARSEALFGALLLALGGCSLVLDADDHRDGVVADGGGRDMTVRDDMSSPDMNGPEDDMSVPDMSIPNDMPLPPDQGPPGPDCDVLELLGGTATSVASTDLDGQEELTIEAWLRPDTASLLGDRNVVGHWGTYGVDGGWALYLNSGRPSFGISTDGVDFESVTSSVAILADRWTHLAATWERGLMTIFVDGMFRGDHAVPGAPMTPASVSGMPLQIAYRDPEESAGDPVEGYVDEVRVSNVVRYFTGDPFGPSRRFEPDAQTLVLYHFDSDQPILDSSARMNDLNIPESVQPANLTACF